MVPREFLQIHGVPFVKEFCQNMARWVSGSVVSPKRSSVFYSPKDFQCNQIILPKLITTMEELLRKGTSTTIIVKSPLKSH